MLGGIKNVLMWFEHRLVLRETFWPIVRHPVPRSLRRKVGWMYVLGSTAMTLLFLQVATGIALSMVYVPSAGEAYESLNYLNFQVPLGWLLRAIHNWSATMMLVVVVVHMIQVFLAGAYKYPRELTWMLGVILFFCTVGMAFTGQVLRWDADSYWGLGVGAAMMGRVPFIGPQIVDLMMGGPMVGGETLSRFFALHVYIIPGILFATLGAHLYLVVRKGISEPPEVGKEVDPATYEEEYEELIADGAGDPFFPGPMARDAFFIGFTLLFVLAIAVVLGPDGPGLAPDPANVAVEPVPDWYFLSLFAVLALSPRSLETYIILISPVIIVGVMLMLPVWAGRGERHPYRRPIAVLSVVFISLVLGVLTWLGYKEPWSPHMNAWTGDAVPVNIVKRLSPTEMQGAVVLQLKACRNCHALDGIGGHRGPDLTYVGSRLDRPALVRQVVQGGGNMPAYGKQLTGAQITALVDFLHACRPENRPPAVVPTSGSGNGEKKMANRDSSQ
ncbi:MAG: cytochrome b N-terminal domain-containing protein [Pirellulales bacterium]|nr:cytochrome b N-terminal domain-containing protein [Pirellulales bacterium]